MWPRLGYSRLTYIGLAVAHATGRVQGVFDSVVWHYARGIKIFFLVKNVGLSLNVPDSGKFPETFNAMGA